MGMTGNFTERKQAEERLRRQNAVLDAISKVFQEALTCETDEDVARTCLAVAEELTGSKFGFIGEVNQAGRFDSIVQTDTGWKACRIPESTAMVMLKNMEIRGYWGKVIKDEQSQIVNDPASHPDRVGTPEGHPPITAFLGIPLKHAGETIGMIGLANKESGYDLADQQDMETLSVAFVEALNHKRIEEALKRRMAELSALNTMAAIVNESLDVNEILNQTMNEALHQVSVEAAAMFLFDEEAGELVMVAHRGVSDEFVKAFSRFKLSEGLSGQAVQTGKPVVMSDLTNYPYARKHYVEKERIQSVVIVPLIGATGVTGTMNLATTSSHYFDAAGLELLVALGRQIAIGVEKARLSQEAFRVVAENAGDGILIATGKGVHIYANKGAAEITGYSIAELLKTSIKGLVHPDEFEKIMERYRKRLEGIPVPRQYETIIIRKDGKSVPIELTAAKTVWCGQPADMVIIRDITERKQAEQELERLNTELARKNRELEQIIYVTSHDLRSPLVNVHGFSKELDYSLKELASAIQSESVPADIREKVASILEEDIPESMQYIHASISKMDSLLSGLLKLSRLGRAAIKIDKLDMNNLISNVVSNFEFQIKEADVKLEISELPPCEGDIIQINQVFSNLLDNALKFLDPVRR